MMTGDEKGTVALPEEVAVVAVVAVVVVAVVAAAVAAAVVTQVVPTKSQAFILHQRLHSVNSCCGN